MFIFYYVLVVINLVLSVFSQKPESAYDKVLSLTLFNFLINWTFIFDVIYLKKVYPESQTTLLSKLTFFWITSLIIKSFRNEISREDVWNMDQVDSCRHVSDTFNDELTDYVERKQAKKKLTNKVSSTEMV